VVALVEAIRRRSLWRELVALAHARRARLAGLALGLAAAIGAWTGVLDLLGLDTRLATATMMMAGGFGAPPARHEGLVLVPIDEAALRAVGRPFDASWRAEHARLIDLARAAGARAVAFDLFFAGPGDDAVDAALMQALQRAQGQMPVLLAANEPAPDGVDGPGANEAIGGVDRTDHGQPPARPHIWPPLRPLTRWGLACAGRRLGLAYAMPLVVARADGGAGAVLARARGLQRRRRGGPHRAPRDRDANAARARPRQRPRRRRRLPRRRTLDAGPARLPAARSRRLGGRTADRSVDAGPSVRPRGLRRPAGRRPGRSVGAARAHRADRPDAARPRPPAGGRRGRRAGACS
jgi:hypothetical protein